MGSRRNPPEASADLTKGLEYDVYGYFKFATDSVNVKSLDREWMPLASLYHLLPGCEWKGAITAYEAKMLTTREEAAASQQEAAAAPGQETAAGAG